MIVDVRDERFDHTATHHTLEALGMYGGVIPSRFVRVPGKTLAQVDAVFGGAWSSELAAGSAWVAEDDAGFLGVAGFDARGLAYRWLRDRPPACGVLGPFGFMRRAHPDLHVAFLHGAIFALRERGYAQAVIPAVEDPAQIAFFEREAGARRAAVVPPLPRRFRAAVLASGTGSNFEAVCAAADSGGLPIDVVSLVCNRANAPVLALAAQRGILARTVVWEKPAERREAYDARLLEAVAESEPDVVLLLGWMHVLPAAFLERFPDAINLHPAFLPLDGGEGPVVFPDGTALPPLRGPRAVDDALAAGYRWTGASAQRVSLDVDRGAVLARAPLGVLPAETKDALMARLHPLEHKVVAAAVRRWADERG